MAALIHRRNVLQHQIMVAETVKAYPMPYPSLLTNPPSLTPVPRYPTCSAASFMQTARLQSLAGPSRLEQMPSPPREPLTPEDGPVGMSASGLSLPAGGEGLQKDVFNQRKQREFIPDNKKDESYWDRRRRNNEAAKRSREKRRINDMILEQRVLELSRENHLLKTQLSAIKDKYCIPVDDLMNEEQLLASMPQAEQLLSIGKRPKLPSTLLPIQGSSAVPSLLSPAAMDSPSTSPVHHHQEEYQDDPIPSTFPRRSVDYYHDDRMDHDGGEPQRRQESLHRPRPLSPPPQQQYAALHYQQIDKQDIYYDTSTALNLSQNPNNDPPIRRASPSPCRTSSEYGSSDGDSGMHSPLSSSSPPSSSPLEASSCLPHKLRHKSRLGERERERDAPQSLAPIKREPRDMHHEQEDSGTLSDDRDSGMERGSSESPNQYSTCLPPSTPRGRSPQQRGGGDGRLRCHLQSLESEIAKINYVLSRRPPQHSEGDSDGSR